MNSSRAKSGARAFSIVLQRDVAILEYQLKLLFRPNHAFCLNVDAKALQKILLATLAIVDCYKVCCKLQCCSCDFHKTINHC